jgi:hypothetical protein
VRAVSDAAVTYSSTAINPSGTSRPRRHRSIRISNGLGMSWCVESVVGCAAVWGPVCETGVDPV